MRGFGGASTAEGGLTGLDFWIGCQLRGFREARKDSYCGRLRRLHTWRLQSHAIRDFQVLIFLDSGRSRRRLQRLHTWRL
jgi:hypothetical protein